MAAAGAYPVRKGLASETGECVRSGCREPAADDSMYCGTHRDAQRAYNRKYKQRTTRRWRRQKRCVHCGGPRRKGDRTCLACRVELNLLAPVRGPGVEIAVEKTERVAAHTRTHADGRTRYHGQGKRGQQPKAQLLAQDARLARERFEAFAAGVMLLDSDEAKTWTRGERERVEKAIASCGESAGRHIDDGLDKLGHFRERHGRREGEG